MITRLEAGILSPEKTPGQKRILAGIFGGPEPGAEAMATATRQLVRATIYWDSQDSDNEGWAYRVQYDDGHEETGPWDGPASAAVDAMVVTLAHQHGVTITKGDVACEDVDGGCGEWMRDAG